MVKRGADEDITLYEQRVPYVLGGNKLTYAFSLKNYLKNVGSDDVFRRGLELMTTMALTENLKMRRAQLTGYIFDVAETEKENTKSEKKEEADVARRRLDIVKAALQRVVAAEKDPENLKEDQKRMKNIFE